MHYERAKVLMIENQNSTNLADLYLRFSDAYNEKGRLEEALILATECFTYCKNNSQTEYAGYALGSMAIINAKTDSNDKFIQFQKETNAIGKEGELKFNYIQGLSNLGVNYKNNGDYQEALARYKTAENLANELQYDRGLLTIYANSFNLLEKYELAEKDFRKGLKVYEKIAYNVGGANIRINLANSFLQMNRIPEAKKKINRGLSLAKNLE